MDALAGILDGPRARGAFVLRSTMRPPWSLRIQDEAPLAILAMIRGDAWIRPDERRRHHVGAGHVAIVRGPRPYAVADDPTTPPQIVIHPGQRCTTPDGVDVKPAMDLGIRSWGNDPDGPTVMVTGVYERTGEVSRRAGNAPAWYRAHQDPLVGKALRTLHQSPAHAWTVAELARASGASRAALARRFTELVGEPPMAYLTSWRLALAADLLREPDATLAAVARQVGYGTGFALSAAFKRVRGVTPRAYRQSGP